MQKGDTLSEIAVRYALSVDQLRRINNLRTDLILEGQRLRLGTDFPPERYTVRTGDTLSEIAERFDVSVRSLRRLNGISGERIYSGQVLKLRQYSEHPEGAEIHVVKRGDTLWSMAHHYGLSVAEIQELNDLRGDTILPEMKLRIRRTVEDGTEVQQQFEYIVKSGDSLSQISQQFDVGLALLRQLNHLRDDRIYPDQRLQLRPSSVDEGIHVVRPEETLSSIALKYHVELSDLMELNGIGGSTIHVGQKLRLRAATTATHIVERGDALWEIARAYRVTVADLERLNDLTSERIYPGQELRLPAGDLEAVADYIVKEGDYLGRIARMHQMSVAELEAMNNLHSAVIYPGDKLKVRPLLQFGREGAETIWTSLTSSLGEIKEFRTGNGPYYQQRPKASLQQNTGYYEGPHGSPLQNYRQARKLWSTFERRVNRVGCLSNTLRGWHIVLDPGHGGLDPGAVVETLDGNGNKVYVVEDEYMYDIALRVYLLLRLHGAKVTLTLLSPNHLVRQSNPPTKTFVNEKNEVFNSHRFSRQNRWRNWPAGGRNGNLSCRVDIARKAFKGIRKTRRIFLSFHADIDPTAPEAPLVLYYERTDGRRQDAVSGRFAKSLLRSLGAGAYARGQSLAVLRDNPAYAKVVLEVRNLAYTDHAWALRFEELRHRDAEKIVRGILSYARRRT
ncbi:MAG: LysM peptidoglycan-binding domain-containing protein [Planctomycetota bacterium]|nr:MAG: LysM peptidoglycan-binding domain-containing protein [Planctomycetota bacterium]